MTVKPLALSLHLDSKTHFMKLYYKCNINIIVNIVRGF